MERTSRASGPALGAVLLALAYFACAHVGGLVRPASSPFVYLWLPSGLVVGVLLRSDPRRWPALVLGALAGSAAFNLHEGRALSTTAIFSAATAVTALAGAWLVRREVGGSPRLASVREVVALVLLAGFASTTLGATLGATALGRQGGDSFASTWATWWSGNFLGVLLGAPLVLVAPRLERGAWRLPRRRAEAAALAATLAATIALVAWAPPEDAAQLRFLRLPLLLWGALRFGVGGASLVSLAVSLAWERFLVAEGDVASRSAAWLQVSLAVSSCTGLVLAALDAEQREAATARDESEARYRLLVDGAPNGIAYCKMLHDDQGAPVDWVYLAVNPAFEKLTGLRGAAGRKVSEVIPGIRNADPELFEIYDRVARTGKQESFERLVVSLGEWFAISVHSPSKAHFVAVFDVVTARHRAEEERRLLAETVAASLHEVYLVDARTLRYRYANDGALRALGLSLERLRALTALDVVPDLTRERTEEILGPLRRHETPRQVLEMVHRRADGTTYPVEVRLQLFDALEAPVLLAFAQDLTERRKAEAALVASSRRWSATFDAISDVILILTPDHEILEVNAAGIAHFGRSREDIVGRKCYEVVHGTAAPVTTCPCVAVAAQGHPALGEIEDRGRSYSFGSWPIRDERGGVTAYAHVIRDVTAQVAESKARRDLEARLHQAQKMEAIGRLAGGVAHDFNNLLTTILGNVSLVLPELPPDSTPRKRLDDVTAAVESAATLTRQLLAFSRKQVVSPVTCQINDVVARVVRMVERLVGEDVKVVTTLAPLVGAVRIDVGRIEQAILNLVVNSRDAMPRGGTLTLETSAADLDEARARDHEGAVPGSYAVLSVTDTGTGMTDEVKAHLFEPFFTTKERGRGTGLGLPSVQGTVLQHGGHVRVTSAVGAGTRVELWLPRTEARPPSGATALPPRPPGGTETVVVVEDEETVRSLAVAVLSGKGYRVREFSDPAAALAALERTEDPVDLVFTDVIMPGMSGPALAEAARRARPGLKVLFTSGYADDALDRHGAGGEDLEILPKPYSPSDLARKVRAVLDAPTQAPS